MPSEEEKLARARRTMIRGHLQDRGITDPRILDAFRRVPRERFVSPKHLRDAYADYPLPIGLGQTISQPYIVALMIQELDVQPSDRVLDVGSGSGYQTALLATLAEKVFAVEQFADLSERAQKTLNDLGITNVHFRVGDGSVGLPDEAPFERIICGAAAPDLPAPWVEQLVDGGRIVLPVGGRDSQTLLRVEKHGPDIRQTNICGVRFVPLLGEKGWAR